MPNHCANTLVVTGAKELLDEFQEFAKGFGPAWDGKKTDEAKEMLALDLNKFVPVPAEVLTAKKNNFSDAYNSGGYDWVCTNWGTKWGCYDVTVRRYARTLKYRYQTAWSPFAREVLEAMAERFPELKFEMRYAEQGMGFCGITKADGGEVTEEQYYEGNEYAAKIQRDRELRDLAEQSG